MTELLSSSTERVSQRRFFPSGISTDTPLQGDRKISSDTVSTDGKAGSVDLARCTPQHDRVLRMRGRFRYSRLLFHGWIWGLLLLFPLTGCITTLMWSQSAKPPSEITLRETYSTQDGAVQISIDGEQLTQFESNGAFTGSEASFELGDADAPLVSALRSLPDDQTVLLRIWVEEREEENHEGLDLPFTVEFELSAYDLDEETGETPPNPPMFSSNEPLWSIEVRDFQSLVGGERASRWSSLSQQIYTQVQWGSRESTLGMSDASKVLLTPVTLALDVTTVILIWFLVAGGPPVVA